MRFKQWFEDWSDNPDDDEEIGFGNEGFWGNAGAGVLPISLDSSRILVQQRSNKVLEPGTWGVFGGALKTKFMKDMNFEAAAKEELREETGYGGQIRLLPAYRFKQGDFKYQNFIGLVPSEFKPHPSWESVGYKWLTWDELLDLEPKHFGLEALIKNSGELIRRYAL